MVAAVSLRSLGYVNRPLLPDDALSRAVEERPRLPKSTVGDDGQKTPPLPFTGVAPLMDLRSRWSHKSKLRALGISLAPEWWKQRSDLDPRWWTESAGPHWTTLTWNPEKCDADEPDELMSRWLPARGRFGQATADPAPPLPPAVKRGPVKTADAASAVAMYFGQRLARRMQEMRFGARHQDRGPCGRDEATSPIQRAAEHMTIAINDRLAALDRAVGGYAYADKAKRLVRRDRTVEGIANQVHALLDRAERDGLVETNAKRYAHSDSPPPRPMPRLTARQIAQIMWLIADDRLPATPCAPSYSRPTASCDADKRYQRVSAGLVDMAMRSPTELAIEEVLYGALYSEFGRPLKGHMLEARKALQSWTKSLPDAVDLMQDVMVGALARMLTRVPAEKAVRQSVWAVKRADHRRRTVSSEALDRPRAWGAQLEPKLEGRIRPNPSLYEERALIDNGMSHDGDDYGR